LNPNPPAAIGPGATAAELARVRADFPGWVFNQSVIAANGNYNIVRYDADIDRALPFDFEVDYVPGAALPPPGTLQWIQFINTNDPVPTAPANAPYVDPQPNDDTLPFYWTEAERLLNTGLGGGVALRFTDKPSRPLVDSPVNWRADLYLVSWNGVQVVGGAMAPTVTIYDGIRWGFDIACTGPGVGTNVSGGVGGDKYDSTGTGGGGGVCTADVPEPNSYILSGFALLALLVWRRFFRFTRPRYTGWIA